MRSQKQVRRAVKVRSLKNAAAGKWKTYRRRLEDRKACTLAPPPPKHRRIKEPKQRSPEELAERQHLREQRRLEKKLAKQRASTSTLPETKKEKKLKEVSSNDSPKKVSAEQKIAAKTVKAKNSTIKETAKTKRLMNESESKHQCLKEERSVSAEEQKICQSSSPVEIEQKELVQSKKHNDVNKTGKKLLEKRGRIEEINKKTKNDKMQPSIPAQIIKLQEPVVPTVLHSVIKEIQQDFLADSDVIDTAEVGTTHEFLKEKAGKKEREIVQLGQLTNEDEKSEIHVNRGKAEGINKEQKKKKRNRRSDADSLLSEHDFVEVCLILSLI
uniref:Uncharacterized protein n=1 Tax=Onchocerca volvulus TaxID=6282 RepID=A0A8R1XTE0_ONCVO